MAKKKNDATTEIPELAHYREVRAAAERAHQASSEIGARVSASHYGHPGNADRLLAIDARIAAVVAGDAAALALHEATIALDAHEAAEGDPLAVALDPVAHRDLISPLVAEEHRLRSELARVLADRAAIEARARKAYADLTLRRRTAHLPPPIALPSVAPGSRGSEVLSALDVRIASGPRAPAPSTDTLGALRHERQVIVEALAEERRREATRRAQEQAFDRRARARAKDETARITDDLARLRAKYEADRAADAAVLGGAE
jgi:hypothetical protein